MKERENDIQKAILDYLTLRGIFHYKQNTAGIYKQSTGSYIPSPSIGAPDIVCVIKGRYVGIEVKTPDGRQSAHQKAFHESLSAAGGVYILARSMDAAIEAVEKAMNG
jgi:hypothetical protein